MNQHLITVSSCHIFAEEDEVYLDQWTGGGRFMFGLPAKCCTQELALDTALFVFQREKGVEVGVTSSSRCHHAQWLAALPISHLSAGHFVSVQWAR